MLVRRKGATPGDVDRMPVRLRSRHIFRGYITERPNAILHYDVALAEHPQLFRKETNVDVGAAAGGEAADELDVL